MTHPTPTAATSASPPPRGKGVGVGGRPLAILAAALLLTTPALAQVIPTGTPAADILLSKAITEQRLFLTCTALDPQTHDFIAGLWAKDVAAAATLLTEHNVPPEAIAAFTAAALPENLLPDPDTPFQDIRKFCATDPDWIRRLNRTEMIRLATDLPKVLP